MQGNPTKIGTGLSQEIAGRPALLKGIWSPEKKSHYFPWKFNQRFFSPVGLRVSPIFSSKVFIILQKEFHHDLYDGKCRLPGYLSENVRCWEPNSSPASSTNRWCLFVAERWCVTSCLWPFTWCHATKNACQETRKVTPLVALEGTDLKDLVRENWYPVSLRDQTWMNNFLNGLKQQMLVIAWYEHLG